MMDHHNLGEGNSLDFSFPSKENNSGSDFLETGFFASGYDDGSENISKYPISALVTGQNTGQGGCGNENGFTNRDPVSYDAFKFGTDPNAGMGMIVGGAASPPENQPVNASNANLEGYALSDKAAEKRSAFPKTKENLEHKVLAGGSLVGVMIRSPSEHAGQAAIARQTDDKSKVQKQLSNSQSAIRSREGRERKRVLETQARQELEDVKNDNKRLNADNARLNAANKFLNELSDRQVENLSQERADKAKLRKTNEALAKQVEVFQQLIINVEHLQTENEKLKIRNTVLEKNAGKDINMMLLKKYEKLKLKNKLLKTTNRTLSLQMMNMTDKNSKQGAKASNEEPVKGVAPSSRN